MKNSNYRIFLNKFSKYFIFSMLTNTQWCEDSCESCIWYQSFQKLKLIFQNVTFHYYKIFTSRCYSLVIYISYSWAWGCERMIFLMDLFRGNGVWRNLNVQNWSRRWTVNLVTAGGAVEQRPHRHRVTTERNKD